MKIIDLLMEAAFSVACGKTGFTIIQPANSKKPELLVQGSFEPKQPIGKIIGIISNDKGARAVARFDAIETILWLKTINVCRIIEEQKVEE